jgi:hypothetical protein
MTSGVGRSELGEPGHDGHDRSDRRRSSDKSKGKPVNNLKHACGDPIAAVVHSWFVMSLMVLSVAVVWSCTGAAATAKPRVLQGSSPQTVAFPYWVADGVYGSVLTLNNPTGNSLFVQPTLYNLSGTAYAVPAITLAAQQQQSINISDWISAAGLGATFKSGSLILSYNAPNPQFLGAQVVILKPAWSFSFDVPPEMPGGFVSSTLQGMWWRRGPASQARIVLTNTGTSSLTATVRFTDGLSHVVNTVVQLGAHRTQVLDPIALAAPSVSVATGAGQVSLGGVKITHTGVAGAMLAYGMLSDQAIGLSTHSQYVDSSVIQTQSVIGTHVMMGPPDIDGLAAGTTFTSVARLRNVSGTTIVVTPVITYKQSSGASSGLTVALPTRTLQPDQLDVMDLNAAATAAGAIGPFVGMGVKFTYTGQTQALVAQITSVDGSGNLAFEVPLKDPGVSMNRYGGSYPFKLDGDYRSVVHLRNTADTEADVTVQLDYEGGKFVSELLTLAPQQEIDVDLKKVRDQQVKDGIEQTLPPGVTNGRLTWFEHGDQAVVGRMEIYSVSAGIASSFSCGYPCCPGSTRSVSFSPSVFDLDVGDIEDLRLLEERVSDCGDPTTYGPFNVTGIATWSTTDASVASVTPVNRKKARITGNGAGPVQLRATYPSGEWIPLACHFIPYFDEVEAPVLVSPVLNGPASVVRGSSATYSVNTGGASSTISGWSFANGVDTVTRTSGTGSNTWAGTLVASGTVTVTVQVGAHTYFLSKVITVANRASAFGFNAVPSVQVPNPTVLHNGTTLGVSTTPPTGFQATGFSTVYVPYTFYPDELADNGPNHGFKYVVSINNSRFGVSAYAKYVIAQFVEDTGSPWYLAQCGNWHPTLQPNGYISGSIMLSSLRNHESGLVNGHYGQYVASQNSPTNNPGFLAETELAGPTVAMAAFVSGVLLKLDAAVQRIYADHAVEPCGSTDATLSPLDCSFQGFTNYVPYVPCPGP